MRLFIFLFAVFGSYFAKAATVCADNDITKFDFKNSLLQLPHERVLRFNNGVADTWTATQPRLKAKVAITKDDVISPDGREKLRIITLEEKSGDRSAKRFFIVTCDDKRLRLVWPEGLVHVADFSDEQCSDIGKVNFKNLSLVIDDSLMNFHGGEFFEYTYLGLPETPESSNPPVTWLLDFADKIVKDEILRPDSSTAVRVLTISRDHASGSGNLIHTTAFICDQGKVKRILDEKHDYGGQFKKLSETEILIPYGVWQKNDGHCCPSKEGTDVYQWSGAKHAMILKRQEIKPSTK